MATVLDILPAEVDKAAAVARAQRAEHAGGPAPAEGPQSAERLRYVLAHPDRVDLVSIAHLREQIRRLDEQYDRAPDDELLRYAISLRPRFRTGILSNSADGARREEQARYGFQERFDVIIYSHEVGLAKPDPEAYALLCDRLDVMPDELVFLDDVPANIDAAGQLGIHGLLHRGTAESIEAISALIAS